MRLFIALNFAEPALLDFVSIQQNMQKAGLAGNYSLKENLHLTLAFLGETEAEELPDIINALGEIEIILSELYFNKLSAFHRNSEALYFLEAIPPKELLKTQKAIVCKLKEKKICFDEKPFRPHLTLARRIKGRCDELQSLLTEPVKADYDHISLMLSERIQGRLTYTELARFPEQK